MPEGWSFFDAAGLFVTGPTSYAGLVVRAGIKKGKLNSMVDQNLGADRIS